MNSAPQLMPAAANNTDGRWFTVNSRMTSATSMLRLATHLVRRAISPPFFQSRSNGPNSRCLSSQAASRGELRDAAQAASSTNSVVGRPGRITPSMAMPILR